MSVHTTPDSYTKLLIHSDTSNGSTTFVDSSTNARAITHGASSDITHATAKSKFGKTAIYRPTSGDDKNLVVGDHADLTRTTDDFTIECWVYMTALTEHSIFLAKGSSWWLNYDMAGYGTDNKFNCMFYNGAAWQNATNTMTPVINTWYHLAAVVSSNELTLYVDGVGGTPTTLTGTTNDGEEMVIGGWETSYTGFTGYLDEIRISKGIARWTDSFVPPNKPYSVVDDDFVTDVAGIEDVGDGITKLSSDIIIKSDPDEASTDSVFSVSAKDGTELMNIEAGMVDSGVGKHHKTGTIISSGQAGPISFPNGSWTTVSSTYYKWVLPEAGTYLLLASIRARIWADDGFGRIRLLDSDVNEVTNSCRMMIEIQYTSNTEGVNMGTAFQWLYTSTKAQTILLQGYGSGTTTAGIQSDTNGWNEFTWVKL